MSTEHTQQVLRKRKLIAKHQQELSKLLVKCPHDEVVSKSYYFRGGYLDKSYIELWDECTLCGHRTNKRDDPNHHGSFG